MMKVITEKQTPITLAQNNTSTNNDVMNMLANMLFASLYVQVNTQPNSTAQAEMASNQIPVGEDNEPSVSTDTSESASASDGSAMPAALLIDQLLQANLLVPTSGKTPSVDRTPVDTAMVSATPVTGEIPQRMLATQEVSASLQHQNAKTLFDNETAAKESESPAVAQIATELVRPTKQDSLKQVDKPTFVNKDNLQDKTSSFKEIAQTQANTLNTNQTPSIIHHVQKPLEDWVAELNHTQANSLAQPQAPTVTPMMTMITESSLQAPDKTTKENNTISQQSGETPMVFHFEKLEPVAGQRDVYEMVIRVTPEELGPVHAKLKMSKNSLDITILTNNSHAEQAIKAHLPQLIEKFQQSSLPLVVSVQQQSSMFLDQGGSNASSHAFNYQHDDSSTNVSPRAQATDKKQENKDALVDTYI